MSIDGQSPEPGRPVVLRGGTVLTMNGAHDVLHDADVLVVGDRIAGWSSTRVAATSSSTSSASRSPTSPARGSANAKRPADRNWYSSL